MHFVLMNLDDEPSADEEVYLLTPGDPSKTAIAVPLDALPRFLPVLERARSVCRRRAAPRVPTSCRPRARRRCGHTDLILAC